MSDVYVLKVGRQYWQPSAQLSDGVTLTPRQGGAARFYSRDKVGGLAYAVHQTLRRGGSMQGLRVRVVKLKPKASYVGDIATTLPATRVLRHNGLLRLHCMGQVVSVEAFGTDSAEVVAGKLIAAMRAKGL